jgi:hypothetical protein
MAPGALISKASINIGEKLVGCQIQQGVETSQCNNQRGNVLTNLKEHAIIHLGTIIFLADCG